MPKSKKRLPNIHPGEILDEEFLKPLGITQYRLAKEIGVPQTRISAILKKQRSITTDTALRLSKYFGTTARFWLNLQIEFDLEETRKTGELALAKIRPVNFNEEAGSAV